MKNILKIFLLISSVVFSRELTLESAIDLGLKTGKTIKTSELSKENADLNVKRAFKAALPKVVYNGKYEKAEHTNRTMEDVYNADGTIGIGSKHGYSQTIGIYQPLFQGGAIAGGILGAKASQNIANLLYLSEKRDVRLNIIELYSNIIKYEKDLVVLNSIMKELKLRYAKQEEQLKLRLITKADLLKTEYNILELNSQITETKTNIEIGKKNLKLKLMIPSKEELRLKEFDIPEDLISEINLKKDLEQALTNSLSYRIARNKVDYAKAERKIAKSNLLPQVEAFTTYGTGKESKYYQNSVDNAEWRGGISVKWNVFEFGSGLNEYEIAKNSEEIENINKNSVVDDIELTVIKNYRELIRLQELRNSKEKALEVATENYKIDTKRYQMGVISTVDFLSSETQYKQAAVEYNSALLNYYIIFEKYRSSII